MPTPQSSRRLPPHVRLGRFFEARPWLGDTLFRVLPLLLLALMFWIGGPATGPLGSRIYWPLMLLLDTIAITPLAASRIRPGLAAGISAFACLCQVLTLQGPGASALAVPLLVYACATYGSRRVSIGYLLMGLFGAVLLGVYTAVMIARPAFERASPDYGFALVFSVLVTGFAAAVVLVAWLFGDLSGRRRREQAAIAEQNRLLERERDQEARLAADAERMRIAREMHDVISHSMSVMIAQADGGRYVLDQKPARAAAAFTTIGETGRAALTEMRRMLGVLREEHAQLARRPAPGLGDLDQLIADVTAAGLDVQLHRDATSIPPLGDGVGLAIYRIVQEALTNTLKHAGAGATATVWLGTDATAGELVVDIRDTGGGPPADDDGAGSGLRGMAERAELYGGRVNAQATATGFVVHARFPLSAVTGRPAA